MIADLFGVLSFYGILFWTKYRWNYEGIHFIKLKPLVFLTPILYFLHKNKDKKCDKKAELGLVLYEIWCHSMTILLITINVTQTSFINNLSHWQKLFLLCSGIFEIILYELFHWVYEKFK